MKTFIIGDIHGANKALEQCLERSGFDREQDLLIQLGDVADGWSQTPECVETLLSIPNRICIRGNHDVWCWNWFTWGQKPIMWTEQGGNATIDSYISTGKLIDKAHRDFWDNQVDYYIDDDNNLFVHAGFDLTYGFEWSKTASVGIPRASELHWSRDCAEFNTKSWGKRAIGHLDQFKEIFIGHTSHKTTRFNYPGKHNIWNIDTGAGWNGKLTIMDVHTKEYWQSDPTSLLYPDERGRK
jgi:serine/threonine protein phosphatase 1